MPMIHRTTQRLADGEHGFTLIETLVAMISGVVVTGATFSILIVALHQTSRITDSVQATQLGRTTMTRVIDELHSACITRKFVPVQAESSGTKLIFINAYSKESVIKKPEAYEHEIEWNKVTEKLTDTVTPASSGEWPNFTFASTPTKTVLGEHIAEGETPPIFKYYEYGETYSSGSSEPVSTLIEMKNIPSNGMSATEAGKVAAVLVSFTTKPVDGQITLSRSAEFSNQVTFAFGSPSSETKIVDGPCQ
jgi:type II secretory pathway pseudopilin PulG